MKRGRNYPNDISHTNDTSAFQTGQNVIRPFSPASTLEHFKRQIAFQTLQISQKLFFGRITAVCFYHYHTKIGLPFDQRGVKNTAKQTKEETKLDGTGEHIPLFDWQSNFNAIPEALHCAI